MDLGIWEIVIIIGIIVLFFGAKKIPELAKGIGEGMSEFKKATRNQVEEGRNPEPEKPSENADAEKTKTQ